MDYEITCGLEVHVELATRSKIFCGCATNFGAPPNTQVCPVCAGMPGTLPVLNRQVVAFAIRTCLALECAIAGISRFDRKNYFYPDLPKAYQISQLYVPIGREGGLEIGGKRVGIHEIHIEEDAGKLLHDQEPGRTCVDYNRCGVPLLEIVSNPELTSGDEVVAYLERLRETLLFLGVSDCKMQEGSMRADVNLSVRRRGAAALGTRTEMKNMSSYRAIRRAIEAEAARQIQILEHGGAVRQETRRWDDARGESFGMRGKEEAQDYRYFPEPDLPPLVIGEDWVEAERKALPELPAAKRARYVQAYGLTPYEGEVLTATRETAALFEEAVALCRAPKETASLLMTDLLRLYREPSEAPPQPLSPAALAAIVRMLTAGTINRGTARVLLEKAYREGVDPVAYTEENQLAMVEDRELVECLVEAVLAEYPAAVADFRGGKTKAFGFLTGKVMSRLQGKGNPKTVCQTLESRLEKGKE